jgi:hypothetical protein
MPPWLRVRWSIAGTHNLFDDDGRVLQIKYRVTDYEGEEHSEWTLMRPGDKTNPPPAPLWNKLMDSARGYDLTCASCRRRRCTPRCAVALMCCSPCSAMCRSGMRAIRS